jgi:hypothetical protein
MKKYKIAVLDDYQNVALSVSEFLHPICEDRFASPLRSAVRSQLITRRPGLRPATLVRVPAADIALGYWNAPTEVSMEVGHEAAQQKRNRDPE